MNTLLMQQQHTIFVYIFETRDFQSIFLNISGKQVNDREIQTLSEQKNDDKIAVIMLYKAKEEYIQNLASNNLINDRPPLPSS